MKGADSMLYLCIEKKRIIIVAICLALTALAGTTAVRALAAPKKDFIRWVDFTPTTAALAAALDQDIASHKAPADLPPGQPPPPPRRGGVPLGRRGAPGGGGLLPLQGIPPAGYRQSPVPGKNPGGNPGQRPRPVL